MCFRWTPYKSHVFTHDPFWLQLTDTGAKIWSMCNMACNQGGSLAALAHYIGKRLPCQAWMAWANHLCPLYPFPEFSSGQRFVLTVASSGIVELLTASWQWWVTGRTGPATQEQKNRFTGLCVRACQVTGIWRPYDHCVPAHVLAPALRAAWA
jgi:hypothetical protein